MKKTPRTPRERFFEAVLRDGIYFVEPIQSLPHGDRPPSNPYYQRIRDCGGVLIWPGFPGRPRGAKARRMTGSDGAVFTVGLRVDKPRRRRLGSKVSPNGAKTEIARLRREQVGDCEAEWYDWFLPSVLRCEIGRSSKERSVAAYTRHMLNLAELLAERFGQQEVYVRIAGQWHRANAPGEKGPEPILSGGRVLR